MGGRVDLICGGGGKKEIEKENQGGIFCVLRTLGPTFLIFGFFFSPLVFNFLNHRSINAISLEIHEISGIYIGFILLLL